MNEGSDWWLLGVRTEEREIKKKIKKIDYFNEI